MSRRTVEASLALDAHTWAEERGTDGTAIERVAALGLTDAPEGAIGGNADRLGLHPVTLAGPWPVHLRGIVWATLAAQNGRPSRVLLGNLGFVGDPAPVSVTLDWATPRGTPSRLPVFHCPGCSRRARYLYLPMPRDVFRCRKCHRLAYRAQNGSRSRLDRTLNRFWLDPQNLAAFTQAKDLLSCTRDSLSRKGAPDHDGLPGEENVYVHTTSIIRWRRVGRPRSTEPRRPVGRPKSRLPYDASGRRAAGCAGRLGPGEGYCVACRQPRRIAGAAGFVASNGRHGVKGQCCECCRGLCRMGAAEVSG